MSGDEDSLDVSQLLPPRCDSGLGVVPHKSGGNSPGVATRPKPRRGWRFSVRALILLQCALAVGLSLVAARVHSFRQQEAIAAKFADRKFCSFLRTPTEPEWFWAPVAALTNTKAEDIYEVHIGDQPLRRAEAVEISRLRRVRSISLTRGVIEQDSLQPFANLPRLTRLELRDAERCHLDDQKLLPIREFSALEHLLIESVNVTNSSIAALAESPSITNLEIHYARLTMDGLRPWVKEQRLRQLNIPLRMEDVEMGEIAKLESLQVLQMRDLSTNGARSIADMPNLRQVHPSVFVPSESALKTLPQHIRVVVYNDLIYRGGEVAKE